MPKTDPAEYPQTNYYPMYAAARDILILEDAHVITSVNSRHSLCALKRVNDISSKQTPRRKSMSNTNFLMF
jgi:hypothetical protein